MRTRETPTGENTRRSVSSEGRPQKGSLTGHLLGAFALLSLLACDAPTESVGPGRIASSANTSRSGAACINVQGTGFASGSALPDAAGNITATGPIAGDLTGTFTFTRDAGGSEQNGNGATFLTYDEILLESTELGTFTGIADASVNFGLLEEGVRTDRGPAHIEFTGPGDRHGFMKLDIVFDLSGFPVLAADYRYHGRLCGA